MDDQLVNNGEILVVVAADKIGRRLVAALGENANQIAAYDKSLSIRRVFRILKRRALPVFVLAKMVVAEMRRKDVSVPSIPSVISNAELRALLGARRVSTLLLFRAGLIVNAETMSGVDVYNVHCARLPDYGGVGAIARALKNRDFDQAACLHRVTDSIDGGEVLETHPFTLDPKLSYRENEDRAYLAGMRLILSRLKRTG